MSSNVVFKIRDENGDGDFNPDPEPKCTLFDFCKNRSVHGCNGLCQECFDCCEHEFDAGEGFMCINCGKQGELSDVYDEDYGKDR